MGRNLLTEMAAGISQLVCPKKSPVRALVSCQPGKSPTNDDIADMELLAATKRMEELPGERYKHLF